MPSRIVRHPLASRRAILAALAALLPWPAAVRGQSGDMCRDLGTSPLPGENHPDFLWWPVSVTSASSDVKVRLQLQGAADGSARVHGAIRLGDDAGKSTLVAEPGSAQATCADTNGDGRAGLTQVQFMARDAQTGQRVPVTLATREGEDIDRDGFGFVTFQDGEGTAREVEVRISLVRRPRRSGKRGNR